MPELMVGPALKTVSIRVNTPDGKIFVHIAEDSHGKPVEVLINIGKSGYALAAWCEAVQRMLALTLRAGVDLHTIIAEISNLRTDKSVMSNGLVIRSGPEGLVVALLRYLSTKGEERDDDYRPARMGR